MEQILISMDNIQKILEGFTKDLYNKINNKDLSTPYIKQFTKAGIIKTDGTGDMFLCNNGKYIKIDLNSIEDINNKIQTIYDLFKIEYQKAEWNSIPANIPFRRYSKSTLYNGKLYRVGGSIDPTTGSNIVDVYDIKTNTWTILKSYPTSIWGIGVNQFNGKIYSIGGTDNYHIYNYNYVYDTETDTWSTATNITNPKMNFMTDIHNGKIYCIGGGWGGTPLNTNDIYDINSNTWSLGKQINTAVTGCNGIYYDKKIYVFGGYSITENKNIVQIYNIDTDTWEQKILVVNESFCLFIYNNEIYKIGNSTDYICKYDIKNNTWIKTNMTDIQKRGFNCCIYNKKVYCINGILGTESVVDNNNIDILNLPYSNYDIKLPDELDNKLNIIKSDGLGNKLLADNGTYIDPSNKYTPMTTEQINAMIESLGV